MLIDNFLAIVDRKIYGFLYVNLIMCYGFEFNINFYK